MPGKTIQQLKTENRKLRAQLDRLADAPLILAIGPLEIDRLARTVCFGDVGSDLGLDPLCFKLAEILALRKGDVVSIAEIEKALWPGKQAPVGAATIMIHRLRTALGAAGALIETIRGQGYRLREEVPA